MIHMVNNHREYHGFRVKMDLTMEHNEKSRMLHKRIDEEDSYVLYQSYVNAA